MKTQLIIATTVTALLAGTSLVSAQRAQESVSPSQSAAPSAPPPPAASEKSGQPGRANADDKNAPKAAQGNGLQTTQPNRAGTEAQPSNRTPPSATQAQKPSSPSSSGAQQSPSGGSQAQTPAPTNSANDRNVNQTNVNVNLTTEQRSRIRQTVVKESNVPRVSRNDVTFNLSVGTVVPRSIRVATLPAAVVEIHPVWRGYFYVLVGDEIVILEPGSLRIVAIIPA